MLSALLLCYSPSNAAELQDVLKRPAGVFITPQSMFSPSVCLFFFSLFSFCFLFLNFFNLRKFPLPRPAEARFYSVLTADGRCGALRKTSSKSSRLLLKGCADDDDFSIVSQLFGRSQALISLCCKTYFWHRHARRSLLQMLTSGF